MSKYPRVVSCRRARKGKACAFCPRPAAWAIKIERSAKSVVLRLTCEICEIAREGAR